MSVPMIHSRSIPAEDLKDLVKALRSYDGPRAPQDQMFCLETFFEAQSFPSGWKHLVSTQDILLYLVREGIISETVQKAALEGQRAVIALRRQPLPTTQAAVETPAAAASSNKDRKTSVAERQAVRESQSGHGRGGFTISDTIADKAKDRKPSAEEQQRETEGGSSRDYSLEESEEGDDNEEAQEDEAYSPCSEKEEAYRKLEVILGVRAAQNRTPQMCHPITPPLPKCWNLSFVSNK